MLRVRLAWTSLGRSCADAAQTRIPDRPTALRCPRDRRQQNPPGFQSVLPSQLKPCKYMCVSSAGRAPTLPFAHLGWWWLRVRSAGRPGAPADGCRAAPTPTRLPQLLGRGRLRRPRTSGPLHPLRSPRTPPAAAARSAPPESPGTGASGAGHGGHAARPVPAGVTCPSGSRARAAANRGERCPGARRLW